MEEQQTGVYDPEDARAFRQQAELLRSQLETAYRDIDKLRRDHDKEVMYGDDLFTSVRCCGCTTLVLPWFYVCPPN